jgi:hypothetical protein
MPKPPIRRPSPLTPSYQWDSRAGRYTSATSGRFVSSATVKAELEKVAARSVENIRALSESLRAGNINLAEWQAGMMREVKTLHVANAAAANGGWAQMSQSDWGHTGNLIKQQYKYLDNFATEISNGKQPLNGRLNVRADMYGKAGRGTFEETRKRYQRDSNLMEEERRILHAAESCEDCIDAAGRGWVPIGTLPRIGQSRCKTNCACSFEYRRMGADGNYVTAED